MKEASVSRITWNEVLTFSTSRGALCFTSVSTFPQTGSLRRDDAGAAKKCSNRILGSRPLCNYLAATVNQLTPCSNLERRYMHQEGFGLASPTNPAHGIAAITTGSPPRRDRHAHSPGAPYRAALEPSGKWPHSLTIRIAFVMPKRSAAISDWFRARTSPATRIGWGTSRAKAHRSSANWSPRPPGKHYADHRPCERILSEPSAVTHSVKRSRWWPPLTISCV